MEAHWTPLFIDGNLYLDHRVNRKGVVQRKNAKREGYTTITPHYVRNGGKLLFMAVRLKLDARSGSGGSHFSNRSVARLVLDSFGVVPPHPKAGLIHRDGNLENCALSNLRWKWKPIEMLREPAGSTARGSAEPRTREQGGQGDV